MTELLNIVNDNGGKGEVDIRAWLTQIEQVKKTTTTEVGSAVQQNPLITRPDKPTTKYVHFGFHGSLEDMNVNATVRESNLKGFSLAKGERLILEKVDLVQTHNTSVRPMIVNIQGIPFTSESLTPFSETPISGVCAVQGTVETNNRNLYSRTSVHGTTTFVTGFDGWDNHTLESLKASYSVLANNIWRLNLTSPIVNVFKEHSPQWPAGTVTKTNCVYANYN